MSDVDILDLMRFFAFVEIEQLLNNFEDIVCSEKVMCCSDNMDDIKALMNIIRKANLKIIDANYQATRMKLLKYHDRNEPVVLLDQFQSLGIMSLQCAEQSLKALLVSEVKCLDKTYSESGLLKVFVIKESNKETWNELKNGKLNSYWNGKLQNLTGKFLPYDDECRKGSLLPIVACLSGHKEVIAKIGIFKRFESCSVISWIEQEHIIKDEHVRNYVNNRSYYSNIWNFNLLKHAFEMMMMVKSPKQYVMDDQKTFKDFYDYIKANENFQIDYFVFEVYSDPYHAELMSTIEKNVQLFDMNKISVIFIVNKHLNCILSLYVLEGRGCIPKELKTISLQLHLKVAEDEKRLLRPIGQGKRLLEFYHECLDSQPAVLSGIGNSCYMASMLQCLKMCFDKEEVDDIDLKEDKPPLTNALFQTLDMMYSPQRDVEATDLRSELQKYHNKFGSGSQQDGFDFLMCLMNKVEKELSESGFNSEKTNGLSKDIFKNKFSFEIQSTWNCKAGHAGESSQLEYAVHVSPHSSEMYKKVELKDCWNEVFGEDEIGQILCQECPGNEQTFEGLLKRTIKNPPEVLIIYVNRWDFNRRSKNEDFLVFELDDFEVNHLGGTSLYSTVAFCEHRGTLNSGHYLAYVRGTNHGVWFKCDDLQDKLEAFQQRDKRVGSRNVYAIFYRRKEMIPR